mgnify:CR=1 FL=1
MSSNHFFNGKTRTYKNNNTLVTWIQLRCIECGKFLGRGRKKVCPKCSPKFRSDNRKIWGTLHPHYHRNLRHLKDPSIPFRNRK